jgi:hypothetical protein
MVDVLYCVLYSVQRGGCTVCMKGLYSLSTLLVMHTENMSVHFHRRFDMEFIVPNWTSPSFNLNGSFLLSEVNLVV